MSKRIQSMFLTIIMLISMVQISVSAESTRKTAVAAYGTPVVDGKIDSVWDSTNYYMVENCNKTGGKLYKGWFKTLWDENNIYVLARIYSVQCNDEGYAWVQDSVDVYIDENSNRSYPYQEDDYQIRSNFNGVVTGSNYFDLSKVKTGTEILNDGFVVEMAFPLHEKTLKENLTMGFEVLMTASESIGIEAREYLWNTEKGWLYNNTDCFGNIKLQKSVDVVPFDEPTWVPPVVTNGYKEPKTAPVYDKINDVSVMFDSNPAYVCDIVYSDEYPCLDINDLAHIIGGSVEDTTLVKGDVRIKFTEGSVLAEDGKGHIMLERAPSVHDGKFYVPASVMEPMFEYTMFYNRFDKVMEIKTGTDYPQEAEVVVYAKDYGAVGDGVHEDGKAILRAVNAAIASGKPARLELEENKTYLVEGRPDRNGFLWLQGVDNFTFDGKNSLFLFKTPTNNFAEINDCANVKIKNLKVDYKETTTTQGVSTMIDAPNRKFRILIDEGFPLPASDEWVKYHYTNASHGGWWFTQIMDPVEPRAKLGVNHYDIFIDSIKRVQDREYEVIIKAGYESKLAEAEVGDRFVINTRMSAYDTGDWSYNGYMHGMIQCYASGDITIDNVHLYATPWHAVNIGMCWGKINLLNFSWEQKDNRLMVVNSDGIHTWDSRGGVILDNCTLMNTLDDQLNTKGSSVHVDKKIDDYTIEVTGDKLWQIGDEIFFIQYEGNNLMDKAFLKSIENMGNNVYRLTVDRKVADIVSKQDTSDLKKVTYVIDSESTTPSCIVRNSKLMYSRRYAWLCRSKNSLYENNVIYECAGSAFSGGDERFATQYEGAYPSAFTMRNNDITAPKVISPDYPIQISTSHSVMGSTASIEGFLLENNILKTNVTNRAININSVKGLYMLNNTIISDSPLESWTTPVVITNSRIDMIDGINFDYKQNVNAVVTIAGCEVDEANIKNIDIKNGNTAKPYVIN